MSTRWMSWEPKGRISTDPPRLQPTKPSKPGSVGFVGSVSEESPKIAVGQSTGSSSLNVDRTQGLAAVELLSRAGARILSHHLRTIAVPKHHDTLEVRRALALLSYGSYAVAHLDPDDQGLSDDDKEQQELWELYDHADAAINGYQR